jgi:hypothetical protein
LLERYDMLREKKAKEVRIRLESREQRERSEIDKSIHAQIYSQSGLEELRGEVKQYKVNLASLKSKYNLKINGINKDIQELNRRIKEVAYPNSDQLIKQLEAEIKVLKTREEVDEEESISDRSSIDMQDNRNFNQKGNFTFTNKQFTHYPETQFLQEDIDLDSSSHSA